MQLVQLFEEGPEHSWQVESQFAQELFETCSKLMICLIKVPSANWSIYLILLNWFGDTEAVNEFK